MDDVKNPAGAGESGEQSPGEQADSVLIRRVEDAGSASVCSFPGMTVPVRFDEDGYAVVTGDDWVWIEPYATAQAIYKVGLVEWPFGDSLEPDDWDGE